MGFFEEENLNMNMLSVAHVQRYLHFRTVDDHCFQKCSLLHLTLFQIFSVPFPYDVKIENSSFRPGFVR